MAEKVEVEIGGRSKSEIAHLIALNIIRDIEGKSLKEFGRNEYLKVVWQATLALSGQHPL